MNNATRLDDVKRGRKIFPKGSIKFAAAFGGILNLIEGTQMNQKERFTKIGPTEQQQRDRDNKKHRGKLEFTYPKEFNAKLQRLEELGRKKPNEVSPTEKEEYKALIFKCLDIIKEQTKNKQRRLTMEWKDLSCDNCIFDYAAKCHRYAAKPKITDELEDENQRPNVIAIWPETPEYEREAGCGEGIFVIDNREYTYKELWKILSHQDDTDTIHITSKDKEPVTTN